MLSFSIERIWFWPRLPLILELCERENGAEAIFGAEISGFTVLQTALQ